MAKRPPTLFRKFVDRVFPSMPDFFGLLAEQSAHVCVSVNLLVEFMETGDPAKAAEIKSEEHAADKAKAHNIQTLNESFATPVDREDIYRAIVALDEVVNYCKTTVYEMDDFGVGPDAHLIAMARALKEGVDALAFGFHKLPGSPSMAADAARAAHKAERNVERGYRRALAELFSGTDYNEMLRRREIYRHVSNAADRLDKCGSALNDIIVKIS